jgi:hypothetical protein
LFCVILSFFFAFLSLYCSPPVPFFFLAVLCLFSEFSHLQIMFANCVPVIEFS